MRSVARLAALTLVAGCSRFGAVYPPRPPEAPGPPMADPAPSRLVTHVSITADALRSALDDAVPKSGDGEFPLLGSARSYSWTRQPLTLRFSDGHLVLGLHVDARVALPLHAVVLPFDLEVAAEPVVSRDYTVKLQSVATARSVCLGRSTALEVANAVAGVFDALGRQVAARVEGFSYDLRPLVAEAYGRVARPFTFPVGAAEGCARVKLLAVEAGPTVICGWAREGPRARHRPGRDLGLRAAQAGRTGSPVTSAVECRGGPERAVRRSPGTLSPRVTTTSRVRRRAPSPTGSCSFRRTTRASTSRTLGSTSPQGLLVLEPPPRGAGPRDGDRHGSQRGPLLLGASRCGRQRADHPGPRADHRDEQPAPLAEGRHRRAHHPRLQAPRCASAGPWRTTAQTCGRRTPTTSRSAGRTRASTATSTRWT